MKKIVLGLGAFLLFAQSGFALTAKEFDSKIALYETSEPWLAQVYRCDKSATIPNPNNNVNVCLKAIKMITKESSPKATRMLDVEYYNTGVVYYFDLGDKIKAYKYWKKAATLGFVPAQKYLSKMCKEDSWACK